MTLEPFKKLKEEIVWESKWWRHLKARYELPDGSERTMEYPSRGSASMIVALNSEGKILVQIQYRPFVESISHQFPAGGIEDGEDMKEAALRELVEESGFSARNIEYLGNFYPSAGFSDQEGHVFLAWDLFEQENDEGDEFALEHIWVTPEELDSLIRSGKMKDAWAIVSWTLAKPKILELIG